MNLLLIKYLYDVQLPGDTYRANRARDATSLLAYGRGIECAYMKTATRSLRYPLFHVSELQGLHSNNFEARIDH